MALLSSCISLGYANICQVENKIDSCNDLGANLVCNNPFAVTGIRTGNLLSLDIKI